MNELIRVKTNENGQQVVSARDLHQYLEVKDHFTQWADRMFEYGFVQHVDYEAINQMVKHRSGIGGTYKTDYVLTLDCAKEISMIQRSEKGKQARQYFIECERIVKSQLPTNYIDALKALVISEESKLLAESNIKELQIELDKSNEWFSIKKVADKNKVNWKSLEWRKLVSAGNALGYDTKKVFDANFPGGVNAYHIEAWKVVYPNFKY